MSRLRELAEQATPVAEITETWKHVSVALPTSNPSDPNDPSVNLDTLAAIAYAKWRKAESLAVLLADAKDALAANVSACCPDYWPDREDSDEQCQECATARALLARIEELEGKA